MPDDLSRKVDAPHGEPSKSPAAPAPVKEKKKKKPLAVVESDQSSAVEEEKNKVVSIVRRLEEEHDKRQTGRSGSTWFLISALLCIALPTFIAGVFYYFVVADRYAAEARFAVRGNEQPVVDALGMLAGLPSSQNVSDSYMVADYITSREMVRRLEQQLPLRQIFADDKADFLNRLNPNVSLESFVKYWNKRVDVVFDATKGTIAVEVQAFSPESASRIATAILDNVRELVNDISASARRDAVQFASRELARAELRLRKAKRAVLDFRLANNELDPTLTAESVLKIAANLEAERAQLATQLASVSGYLSDDAPSIQMLKSRIAALQSEIGRIQGQISDGSSLDAETQDTAQGHDAQSGAMASTIGEYQELEASQEFAAKAYATALASLERARAEAERTQAYLAIYMPPTPTDEAAYPRRAFSVLVVFVLSAVIWAIGLLSYLTIRDHVA
jgi:capsular polysaccharide transport system permease protein